MNMPAGRLSSLLELHRSLVIAIAAVLPLAACGLLSAFRESIANTNAALGLVLLIVAAAATGIRPAGLLAAVSSAAWFDFFLPSLTTSSPSPSRPTSKPPRCWCWSARRSPRSRCRYAAKARSTAGSC